MPTFYIETASNTGQTRKTPNLNSRSHHEYIGDVRRFDQSQNGVRCLLLRLSVVLGAFPANGEFAYWPAIATTILTISALFILAIEVYMDFGQWVVDRKVFRNTVLISFAVNVSACVVSQCISLHKNRSKIQGIFENFDQNAWVPTVLTIYQMLSRITTGVHDALTALSDTNKIELFCIQMILTNIMALVAVQFGAFIRDIATKISYLTSKLKSQANSINCCLEQYFKIVSLIHDTNRIYKWQMLFVLSDVFWHVVIHGYFFLTDPDLTMKINSMGTIAAEAGLVIYVATSCQNTQNKANEFMSELYTALRNHSGHLADAKKLELIIRKNEPLGFSAGGFIEIGNGLLTSMAAAVVTSLVTLVQLQGGLPN